MIPRAPRRMESAASSRASVLSSPTWTRKVEPAADLVFHPHVASHSSVTSATIASPLTSVVDGSLRILPGTPADAAIQAQAMVRVTKWKKLARSLHAHSIGRVLRHGVLLLPSSGNKRGKPPRVPLDDRLLIHAKDSGHDIHPLLLLDTSSDNRQDDDRHVSSNDYASGSEPEPHSDDEHSSWDGLSQSQRTDHEEDMVPPDSMPLSMDDISTHSAITAPPPPPPPTSYRASPLKARFASVISNNSSPRHSLSKLPSFHPTETPKETLQEKRLRRKQARQEKKLSRKNARKSYVKGKVIDRQHELYALSIAMMLGLRTSIGVTNAKLLQPTLHLSKTWLTHQDFMQVEKYEFKPSGGTLTPPHQLSHTFKIKGYSPLVFAYIRRLFGINEREFLLSVCGRASYIEFISNAKSGQFFFYSNDGKFMIKTMTNAESKFLRRILPHYFQHCVQHPNTLITKFLGMYRVKMYHLQRKVKFIIMNSVFDTDKVLQSFFDLKGSTLGRQAKQGQSVKKDNDVRKGFPDTLFSLQPDVQQRMRHQLTHDLEFLKRMKIMDYSMLIGVHHIPCAHANTDHGSKHVPPAVTGLNFRDPTTRVMQRVQPNECNSGNVQHMSSPVEEKSDSTLAIKKQTSSGSLADRGILNHMSESLDDTFYSASSKPDEAMTKQSTQRDKQIISNPASRADTSPTLMETDGTDENLIRSVLGAQTYESYSTLDDYSSCSEEGDDRSLLEEPIDHDPTTKQDLSSPMNEDYIGSLPGTYNNDFLKERMAEDVYWPFQRFYTYKGRRRLHPRRDCTEPTNCMESKSVESPLHDEYDSQRKLKHAWVQKMRDMADQCLSFNDRLDRGSDVALKEGFIPIFEPPLSNRKDGGFLMDTNGCKLPFVINVGNATQYCDGKIFYMGIIDVLQQFNIRKRLEARLRRIKGGGWEGASCVHPFLYADRFLRFFDEYTATRASKKE